MHAASCWLGCADVLLGPVACQLCRQLPASPSLALLVTHLLAACRIERSNLFEALCGLLSKTAFPVSGSLHAVHLQSLDGILAILTALADGCVGVSDLGALPAGEESTCVACVARVVHSL